MASRNALALVVAALFAAALVSVSVPAFVEGVSPQVRALNVRGQASVRSIKVGDVEITQASEDDEGAAVAAGSLAFFVVGLIFPVLGGFTLGLILASGALFVGNLKPKTAEAGDEFADYSSVVKSVGKYGVKVYNYGLGVVEKSS